MLKKLDHMKNGPITDRKKNIVMRKKKEKSLLATLGCVRKQISHPVNEAIHAATAAHQEHTIMERAECDLRRQKHKRAFTSTVQGFT